MAQIYFPRGWGVGGWGWGVITRMKANVSWTENNFVNMLKIVQNSGNLQDFWTIFNILAKLIFALKFKILVLSRTIWMHKNFHKVFYSRLKNESDCNIAIFISTSLFWLSLGEITHIYEISVREGLSHFFLPGNQFKKHLFLFWGGRALFLVRRVTQIF